MIVTIAVCLGCLISDATPWKLVDTGVKARLRGVSALDNGLILASGTSGTVIRSIDGGTNWSKLVVPKSEDLDFRDVQAIDNQTAFLMSAGPGDASRIYKTSDSGQTWTLNYREANPKGFLDAVAVFNPRQGLALGDPLDGRFQILKTDDAGESWLPIAAAGMPEALKGEGCFAASGTCLITLSDGHAWFGTGGAEVSRIFRSSDFGTTWQVSATPIAARSPSKGIFGLAFHDSLQGFAIGGDFKAIAEPGPYLARTLDGGASWTLLENRPSGFREAVGFVPETNGKAIVSVGPSGSELSEDAGQTWQVLGGSGFDSATCFRWDGASWAVAVGDEGKVALRRLKPNP